MKTWKDIHGWFDFAAIYREAVSSAKDGDVLVELGSWMGKSAAFMGELLRNDTRNLRFYTVDWGQGSVDTERDRQIHSELLGNTRNVIGILIDNLKDCGVSDFVTPIIARTDKAAALFADESVHFVYVDGGHSYEQVMRDLNAWWPKVKPGGIIAGHDFEPSWPGVVAAVNDFLPFERENLSYIPCQNSWSVQK